MAKVQSELDELINQLSHHELVTLQHTLLHAVDVEDGEISAEIMAEEQAARTTPKATIVISKRAMQALSREAERRIQLGAYPSSSGLASEAITAQYGSARTPGS